MGVGLVGRNSDPQQYQKKVHEYGFVEKNFFSTFEPLYQALPVQIGLTTKSVV